MRTSLAFALLALVPALAPAAEIREYRTRLDVDAGGSGHASGTLVIAGTPSETLEVPTSYRSFTNFRLSEATEGLRVQPPATGGGTIRVTLPPAAATAGLSRLTFSFDVPEAFVRSADPANGDRATLPRESRSFRYAFVNAQATPILDFGMLVILPPGTRFQAIREQLPKRTKSEAEPRVRLGGEGGLQTALLRLANLHQGDDTSMQLEVVPNRRSPLWLVAGFALSVLYLVQFRDLVSRKPQPAETR
jgi:hypothetical protein